MMSMITLQKVPWYHNDMSERKGWSVCMKKGERERKRLFFQLLLICFFRPVSSLSEWHGHLELTQICWLTLSGPLFSLFPSLIIKPPPPPFPLSSPGLLPFTYISNVAPIRLVFANKQIYLLFLWARPDQYSIEPNTEWMDLLHHSLWLSGSKHRHSLTFLSATKTPRWSSRKLGSNHSGLERRRGC